MTMEGVFEHIAREMELAETGTGQVEALLRANSGDLQCSDIALLILAVGSTNLTKAEEVFTAGISGQCGQSVQQSLLYASMISVCVDNGDVERGLDLLLRIRSARGPPPSWELLSETFCALLTACENSKQLESALLLHTDVVHTCLKSKEIATAIDVLDCMHGRGLRGDATVYCAVMRACEEHSDHSAAVEMFLMMQMAGLEVDGSICHVLMKTVMGSNMIDMGLQLLQEAERAEIRLEACTYTSLVAGLMESGDPGTASRVFEQMGKFNIMPDAGLASKFVEYCLRTGRADLGSHWFRAFENAGIRIEMEQPRELVLILTQRMMLRSC